MRLINAHVLLEELQKATALSTRGPEYNRGLLEAQRLTINAPTIDIPVAELDTTNEENVHLICPYCLKDMYYTKVTHTIELGGDEE